MDKKIDISKIHLYAIVFYLVMGILQYLSAINTTQYSEFYTRGVATSFMFRRQVMGFAVRVMAFMIVANAYIKHTKKAKPELSVKEMIALLAVVWGVGFLFTIFVMAVFILLMSASGVTF